MRIRFGPGGKMYLEPEPKPKATARVKRPKTIVLADGSEVPLLRFGGMYCATTEKGLAIWGRTKAEVVLFSGMTLKPTT